MGHPSSGGGCPDGGCCKVSLSLYSITHGMDVSIMLTARINMRTAEGNHEFWKCQQKIQAPAYTTEPEMTTNEDDIVVRGGSHSWFYIKSPTGQYLDYPLEPYRQLYIHNKHTGYNQHWRYDEETGHLINRVDDMLVTDTHYLPNNGDAVSCWPYFLKYDP